MNLISSVTSLLSILTVVAQILIVLGLISYFLPGRIKVLDRLFSKYLVPFTFVIPVIATLGSLFLSEIAHFTPCLLCWYQRIFMYPLAFILTAAYFLKDKTLGIYTIILSLIGAVIAFYHYLLQINALKSVVPCSDTATAVDCAAKPFMHFGYISIPMMALSAFLLIIVLSAHQLRTSSGKK